MKITLKELVTFALLSAILFVSDQAMEFLPNIHLIGVLTVAYTLVYRWKALIPLYGYILLQGVFAGFALWWVPYLYVWAVLWVAAMFLPRTLTKRNTVLYTIVCAAHGFLFGVLYAPSQVLLFGLSWEQLPGWILTGLSFDILMGVGNAALSILIVPIVKLLQQVQRLGERM